MNKSQSVVKVLCGIFIIQITFTVLFLLKIYNSDIIRPNGRETDYIPEKLNDLEKFEVGKFSLDLENKHAVLDMSVSDNQNVAMNEIKIYGKAAVGIYLWEHILGGKRSVNYHRPGVLEGSLIESHFNFSYSEGPGVNTKTAGKTSNNIVLVSNGRTEEKVNTTEEWIKHLNGSKVVLVLLGNEECLNNWMQKYMHPKGPIRGVFLVYDDPVIDGNRFHQWPLGVATYRQFPLLTDKQIQPELPRKYLCNLQATNYRNSTRSLLFDRLKDDPLSSRHCYLTERAEWKPRETTGSMNDYVLALIQSDLTLCPSGFNVETYRLYEALEAGSVPVVIDEPSRKQCDSSSSLRLMRQFNAPFIWLKNWDHIHRLLETEQRLSLQQKVQRRRKLRQWYEWFKQQMKRRFLSFLEQKLIEPN